VLPGKGRIATEERGVWNHAETCRVPAQVMYDLREATGFCSGTDLHEFFRGVVGEPSPSGKVLISTSVVEKFILCHVQGQVLNSPSLEAWGDETLAASRRLLAGQG
jgi:hypothetical protein